MTSEKSFGKVLEDADRLTPKEQEELMDVFSRRIAEGRRQSLAQDIRGARSELSNGRCKPVSPDELMMEILS